MSLGSNYTFAQAWRHCLTIGRGSDSDKLQALLGERYDGKQTLLFSKGRDALAAAVKLATGGTGKVAITSLTCYSVVEAVEAAGCEVVYVESSPETLQFSAETLAAALKQHDIKAVIVQNMLGIPVDIDKILEESRQAKIAVIEDLAHAVGGHYADGREIGTIGDYTMLSFGRDKLLDTINGGALVIRTDHVHAEVQPPTRLPSWLQQLRDRIYPPIGHAARALFPLGLGKYVTAVAYKLRLAVRSADGGADTTRKLPHWQAKRALEQMQQLNQTVASRREKQERYLDRLSHLSPDKSSNAIRLPLLTKNRDDIVAKLKRAGYFAEDIWYDIPVSPQRLAHRAAFPVADFPVAMSLSKHLFNLPTHQLVTRDDIDKICDIVLEEAHAWKP